MDRIDLRSYVFLDSLQPQYAAFLGTIEEQMATTDRKLSNFDIDALVLVPGEDGITSPAGGTGFASRVNRMHRSLRVTLVQYKDIRAHDLLRSSVGNQALGSISDWIESRLAA